MTDQPPPEIVEPKSLPDNLPPTGEGVAAPNAIEDHGRGRTGLVVWALIGAMLLAGLVMMGLGWRQVRLPSLPSLPEFSLDAPDIRLPDIDRPEPRRGPGPASVPADMSADDGSDARPVGETNKPGGTDVPPESEAGVLSGGTRSGPET